MPFALISDIEQINVSLSLSGSLGVHTSLKSGRRVDRPE